MDTIERIKEEFEEFKRVTDQFYNGEITKMQYKSFSGGFGSYAQRSGDRSMIRLKITGGMLDIGKMGFICDMIKAHKVDMLHATTGQSIQLHNLKPESVYDIALKALDYGIITRGGGGDHPRNILMDPLSGVNKNETFDVRPYVRAAEQFIIKVMFDIKLPRKLKISFTNTDENVTHSTFRDLGFVARADGTFDVYSAGGLGFSPRMGVLNDSGVKPEKILYYIQAMINTFLKHGNYENRAKSRTRYMQETLGVDGYKAAFKEELGKITENLDISPEQFTIEKRGDKKISGRRITEQKQEGLYAVKYHPVGGIIDPENFIALYEVIKNFDGVEMRISPNEDMYVINCTADEAQAVLDVTKDSAESDFEESVSCIGTAVCQAGVQKSQELLRNIISAVKPYNFPTNVLPKFYVSGCPSSCGAQQTGKMGFSGRMKPVDKKPQNAYMFTFGGSDILDNEKFGDETTVMLADNIPDFMVELGKTIQAAGSDFDSWTRDNRDEFSALVNKYCG